MTAPHHASTDSSPLLVVSYGRIGDVVRSLSAVRLLHERQPGRPIDFICRAPADEIARFAPEIRHVIAEHAQHNEFGWREKYALWRHLRAERYGRAYVLSRAIKPALIPFLAGIPERFGYIGEGRVGLLNRIRWDEAKWRRLDHLNVCAPILDPGEAMPASVPPPHLVVRDDALAAWRRRENVPDDGVKVLALAPGASWEGRRWPIENFAEIARRAASRGWRIFVLGAPSEKPMADAIAAKADIRDFTPSRLGEAVYQLRAASVFLGQDSGLLHVAAALGVPSIGMFGPSSI